MGNSAAKVRVSKISSNLEEQYFKKYDRNQRVILIEWIFHK